MFSVVGGSKCQMDHLGQVVQTYCVKQRLLYVFCLPFISIFAFGDEGSDSEFEELECRRLFDCVDHPECKVLSFVLAFVLAFEFVVVIVFEIVIGGAVWFVLFLIMLIGLFG